jgi:hypothetical protein
MHIQKIRPASPTGYSFRISELVMLRIWAENHGFMMAVELDYCVDGEDYEEVVTFHSLANHARMLILWRAPGQIVVQPLIGRPRRFVSVSDAVESLAKKSRRKRFPVSRLTARGTKPADLADPLSGLAA